VLIFDAAEEGRNVILSMLVVGLIFLGTILLGELTHWLGQKRQARRRARRAVY
jgi:hypothetical protein